MVFPKNNLPVQSQPWTRDVEKRVENLESTFRSAEVNNATRDSQALSQIRRLDAAVTDVAQAAADATAAAAAAQAAANTANTAANTANTTLNGLISLGTDGSSYSVHGGNITANTITANEINSGYIYAGTLNASQVTAGTMTADRISGGTIDATNVNVTNLNASNITSGTISADRISGGVIAGVGNITSGGTIFATVNLGCGQNLAVSGNAFITGDITTGGPGTTGAITRSALAGGGTTGASFTNSGALVRTSSSQRYKTDIQLLDINLNDLYQLEPKTFKRIEEVQDDVESARTYPGFIAEELAGTSLDKFVFYSQDENGNPRPEGIHYPELTAALLLAIKDLNARIQVLEGGV